MVAILVRDEIFDKYVNFNPITTLSGLVNNYFIWDPSSLYFTETVRIYKRLLLTWQLENKDIDISGSISDWVSVLTRCCNCLSIFHHWASSWLNTNTQNSVWARFTGVTINWIITIDMIMNNNINMIVMSASFTLTLQI